MEKLPYSEVFSEGVQHDCEPFFEKKTRAYPCFYCFYFDNLAGTKRVCGYILMCVRENRVSIVFCFIAFLVCVQECVRACTYIDISGLERKRVCCTWLFCCLGELISLKWPPSIFIKLREREWRRVSRREKDGKKQWLALIDRGADKRGVETERERAAWGE